MNARLQRDYISRQKHKYNEFYLLKWEICRKLEEQRLEAEAEQRRKQKLMQLWVGQMKAYRIAKQCA